MGLLVHLGLPLDHAESLIGGRGADGCPNENVGCGIDRSGHVLLGPAAAGGLTDIVHDPDLHDQTSEGVHFNCHAVIK